MIVATDNSPRETISGQHRFELHTIGRFELIDQTDGAVITIGAAKMRALLLYLAAMPRLSEQRRRLATLLWPDSGEEQARQSLRQLLSNFRRAVPADAQAIVIVEDGTIRLDPSLVLIDRKRLAGIDLDSPIADLEEAATRYRGDFGSGAEVGESDFDDWLHGEQVRTRELAIAVFDRLVRQRAGIGHHRDALRFANRLFEIDPLREETHRLIIAEETIVSGRASAMLRFENFRVLLRDELGVRPEAATLSLIDNLRTMPPADGIAPATAATNTPLVDSESGRTQPPRMRPALVAAIAAGCLVAASAATWIGWYRYPAPTTFVGEDNGRVSVIVAPFESTTDSSPQSSYAQLQAETRLAFAHNPRLSVVQVPNGAPTDDPLELGHQFHARYVVQTKIAPSASFADVSLYDSGTNIAVSTSSIANNGPDFKFARELYRYAYSEMTLHRAKTLSVTEPDSIPALLWQAEAARIRTRVGAADRAEFALFERVLARQPDQFFALLGLSECLVLKVARNQSDQRKADIRRAADLLRQAREQAPNLAEIVFLEGMLKKLQGQFELAEPDFERAFHLDRTHWNAAAQAAHVKMFLGQIEEAYAEMEAAVRNLLPDIAAAETAYIAGETALVAGHPKKAVGYLDMAVQGNATIARIHGLRAGALWMAGRRADAHQAAILSQSLTPAYPLALMARRGGPHASPRYKAARDRFVAAFEAALSYDHAN